LNGPYLMIQSLEYSEHVGKYLQLAGIIGEIKERYTCITNNKIREINFFIVYYLSELKIILFFLQSINMKEYYWIDKL
jgi:hypothetical protein